MKSKVKFLNSKIIIITGKIEEALNYYDLMYVKYKDPYCRLYFSGGAEYPVDISLSCLLINIPYKTFFRCNRTEVINLYYFRVYNKEMNKVILEDGATFQLSVRNIAVFKKKMEYM